MANTTEKFAKQVLKLTNDFRKENGLKPLKWDPELAQAAQDHSENMGKQDFFDHTGKDGSKPWDRTAAAGDDNNRIGENIAAGQRTPEDVVKGWIKSPGHRRNMLDPNYQYLGVGFHEQNPDKGSKNYQYYWTQDFGGGGTPPKGGKTSAGGGETSTGGGETSAGGGETSAKENNPGSGTGNNNSGDNSNDEFTKQVLKLTNDFRKENGLKPLKWDPELAQAAQDHSENMGKQDFFDHTGKDGSKPWDRTAAAGDDNNRIGENIAAGQRTPEDVVKGWIKSPGHRRNMLDPNYQYLGVGFHEQNPDKGSENYQYYWTQDFGGGGTPPKNSKLVSASSNSDVAGSNSSINNSGINNSSINNSTENNLGSSTASNNSGDNSNEEFTQKVLELTNDFREENGLEPLKWDPELAQAAQDYSETMGEQDFFDHTGKDGSLPWDRTAAAGDDNTKVGENIAAGQLTPEEVVQDWINSPDHRENMLDPDYEFLGVGYHEQNPDTGNLNYNYYWTQEFGGGGTPPETSASNDNPQNNNPEKIMRADTNDTSFGGNQNDKDMLMGKSKNEALAGDFVTNNTDTYDNSGEIENYNPESIGEQNQSLSSLSDKDPILVAGVSNDTSGIVNFSPETWMNLRNTTLADLNLNQGDGFTDFSKDFSHLSGIYG